MIDLESIYLKLPIFLQNVACSLEGLRIKRIRYSKSFFSILQEIESRTFFSPSQLEEYQSQHIQKIVRHCASSVPYYRELFRKNGVPVEKIKSRDDLARYLPILTKAEIQAHPEQFVSEAIPASQHISMHTSGTTGAGLRFVATKTCVQHVWAFWWRYRRWHGLDLNEKCAYFGGRTVVPLDQKKPPFWRYNIPGRQLMFSGYHMSPSNLGYYVEKIKKSGIRWLHGYPSLLSLLANYLLENNDSLKGQIKWVTIGAENLLPHQAHLMQKAFGVRPIQHYGLAEAVANISECPKGRLHVDEDFSAVEFLPTEEKGVYRIIGTGFLNLAMPMLRYDTGDLAFIEEGAKCDCGRGGRIVSSLDGRKEDYVLLKNGARIGRLDHIFKDLVNIAEAQVYQKEPGEVIFRIVKGNNYTKNDEALLIAEARKRLGQDTSIKIEYVSSIERTASGKLRMVVSDIPEGSITNN